MPRRSAAAAIAALRMWLRESSSLPRIQHEPVVRLLAADLGSDDDVLLSLDGLERDIEAARELVTAALDRASTLPHRERYLKLVHRFGALLLDAHEQWLEVVRAELAAGGNGPGVSAPRSKDVP
jgi:hypothetical protein